MNKGFNFDNPLFTGLSRFADLLWLNILYIICCIPIFTIGAATTSLYYVTLKMAKDEESYITKSFFKSFKQNFKQATGIWMVFVVLFAVVITDVVIVNRNLLGESLGASGLKNVILVASGVIGIVAMFILIYVFPILAQFENSTKNTVKNAFLISIRHLPYTVLFVVIIAVPVVLMYFSNTALMLVFIIFSLIAYINSQFFKKIFVLYMPEDTTGSEDEHIFSDGEENV